MLLADSRWLWALVAVPLLLLIEWQGTRRAAAAVRRLVGDRADHALLLQRLPGDRRLGLALRLTAMALLIVGAAGPEWGREVVRRSATGSDVILVVDVSASMDARDVAPSRLEEARREALAVLDRLEGSRVAVVAFAGDAVRLCPLTLDRSAARLTIEALSSNSVSTPGTDLGRALRTAAKVVPNGHRDEQAIVLWTDGEDLEQGARDALEETVRSGIRVFAIGVGTPAGDVVPTLDEQGRSVDVKRNEAGAIVRSRLDENLLRTIGRRTRGAYFSASRPGGELPRLLATIATMARSTRGSRLIDRPIARFRLFAMLAIALLALELTRARRRREAQLENGPPLHSERGVAAAGLLLGLLLVPQPVSAQTDWARGDDAFKAGRRSPARDARAARWAVAESLYARRARSHARGGAPDPLLVNLSALRALRGDTTHAEADLARLAERGGVVGRTAGYDLGTALGERHQNDAGLAALRSVLERNPRDRDARYNFEVLLARKQQDERQKNQPKKPEPKPQSGGSGGGGAPQPNPGSAGRGSNLPQSTGTPPPRPAGGTPANMDRAQAERLLGALEELSRTEQQHQHKVRVPSEHRGRDW
jgi:Ca-activated chloride channel homolog